MEKEDANAASKRVPKMTAKAQEERLNQLTGTRKAKLGHLTRQMREIENLLMDAGNVDTVYECIE
ncbi:cytosolic carboxypeptidase 2, partial [Clarias magur]